MLVQDWNEFWDEMNNKMNGKDWFNDLIDKLSDNKESLLSIAIKDGDKLKFKDGTLYVTKEKLGSTLSIACDKWKDVIEAIAKGSAEDEKRKKEEDEDKKFVKDLIDEIEAHLKDIPSYRVLKVFLSEKTAKLLKTYRVDKYNEWNKRFKYNIQITDKNIDKNYCSMTAWDYKIMLYDEDLTPYAITGNVGFGEVKLADCETKAEINTSGKYYSDTAGEC